MEKFNDALAKELYDAISSGDRGLSVSLARDVLIGSGATELQNLEMQYPVWQKIVKQISGEQFREAMKTGSLPPVKLTPMELDVLRGGSGMHGGVHAHLALSTTFSGHFAQSTYVHGYGHVRSGSTVVNGVIAQEYAASGSSGTW